MMRATVQVLGALSALGCFVAPFIAVADGPSAMADADGALHVRELVIPPSDLWSQEFQKFYAQWPSEIMGLARIRTPSRDAPKAQWDEFDRSLEAALSTRLEAARERYPVNVVETRLNGVRVAIISPREGIAPENQGRVLINLHAGGFVKNRGLTAGQLESIPVASLGRIKVITVDYRQAPSHRYPAASEDVEAVYREVLKKHAPASIGLFGCSAGGTLSAQATAWFASRGLPRPGAVGIFCASPDPGWVRSRGDSAIWLGLPQFRGTRKASTESPPSDWYMEGVDKSDPLAYPGASDAVLATFPPTLFLNGTRDFTLSAALVAHARLLKLGVDSSLYVIEGAPHGALILATSTPEVHDAHAYAALWFNKHLAR